MYFDRFDICAAYYHFADTLTFCSNVHHGLSIIYSLKISRQLTRLKYKPGISDSNLATISDNAKTIYMNLIREWLDRSKDDIHHEWLEKRIPILF